MLLDTYAPLKRVKKYKMKFKSKPWITVDLLLRRKFNNNNQNKSGLIIQRWSGGLMFQITHLK